MAFLLTQRAVLLRKLGSSRLGTRPSILDTSPRAFRGTNKNSTRSLSNSTNRDSLRFFLLQLREASLVGVPLGVALGLVPLGVALGLGIMYSDGGPPPVLAKATKNDQPDRSVLSMQTLERKSQQAQAAVDEFVEAQGNFAQLRDQIRDRLDNDGLVCEDKDQGLLLLFRLEQTVAQLAEEFQSAKQGWIDVKVYEEPCLQNDWHRIASKGAPIFEMSIHTSLLRQCQTNLKTRVITSARERAMRYKDAALQYGVSLQKWMEGDAYDEGHRKGDALSELRPQLADAMADLNELMEESMDVLDWEK